VLVSNLHGYTPEADGETLVRRAMASPCSSPCLSELARGRQKIVIIASDHTRPVPSKVIIPPMLEEIRAGNNEFAKAKKSIEKDLKERKIPEVDYFFEHFIPSLKLTLDDLEVI
jgi:hypothetical protein